MPGDVAAGGGGAGSVAALDDLTDVDTTTTAPAPDDMLKFNAATGLWTPGKATVETPVGGIDVTDTPPTEPPYIGYAYLTSDGKLRIWNGTDWRQLVTTAYVPPLVGDAVYNLPSLVGHYRANDLVFADGDPVTAWPDLSTVGNHLTVNNPGAMQLAGIGGLKSVVFTKSTQYLLPAPVGRPVTVIGVMKNTDTGSGSILFSNSAASGTYPYVGLVNGAGIRASDGSSTYIDYPLASVTDPLIYYGRVSTTAMMAGANGGKSSAAASIGLNVQSLGVWWAAPGYSMQGQVSEMLVYNDVLADAQLDAIVHQLGLTYGIAVSV